MTGPATLVWGPALLRYDFGPGHPMRSVRVDLTVRLADALGILDRLTVRAPAAASDTVLATVHDPAYIVAVRDDPGGAPGLQPPDNPPFPGVHEAAALVAGASVAAADAVWGGEAVHAANIAGGLHHAQRAAASGFCVYNDAALAVRRLLDAGARRVAYVDLDVHHGDGVQAAFVTDPRVLTVSLHQSGELFFPGTGWPDEVGEGAAAGTAVNVALPRGTDGDRWLRAFAAVVPTVLREFRPEVLVTQCGADGHRADPLGELALTVEAFRSAYAALHALAHELCGGRWVALGGGGYAHVQAVPRVWAALLAELAGIPLADAATLPASWRAAATARTGVRAPERLGDGPAVRPRPWPGGVGDPDDPVDRAIAATRHAVWPLLGLDPLDARD